MLYTYEQCIDKYGSNYQLEKKLHNEELYKVEKGIYSDKKNVMEIEIIIKKYPKAIFTMDSAFYFHSLTDDIPDEYSMVTDRNAAKIRDDRIKQYFCALKTLDIGKTTLNYQGVDICIYDKERLLIELIRNKNKLPFDYYKEIISNYRNRIYEIDIEKLQEYTEKFPWCDKIEETIQLEVF